MVGQLAYAVVNGNAALPRGHVLLRHLHPAQGAHGEALLECHQQHRGREGGGAQDEQQATTGREETVQLAMGGGICLLLTQLFQTPLC